MVGKALLWKARQMALTVLHLFADDFFGFGTIRAVQLDSEMVIELLRNVIGEGALAPNKHELGQQIVIIGWYINLIDPRGASIRPKDEAIDKLMHAMFSFDEKVPQPLQFWESLAGLIERMSQGCWGWKEHTTSFHGMATKCHPTKQDAKKKRYYGGKSKSEPATATCLFSIEVLRAHLILMWLDKDRFAIPLEQFVCLAGKSSSSIEYVGISDACQHRGAIAIYKKNPFNESTELIAWMSVKWNYVFKSGYRHQNYVEYNAVVLQYILMNILFPLHGRKDSHPLVLQTRTDNMSAKAWIEKKKCSSLSTQKACMAQTYMQMFSKVDIASVVYHPGNEMKDIDLESRREEFLAENEFCKSLPPEMEVDLEAYPIVGRFVELADPTKYAGCEHDMQSAYRATAQEFGAFIHRSDPPLVKFKTPPSIYQLVEFDHGSKRRLSVQTRHFV